MNRLYGPRIRRELGPHWRQVAAPVPPALAFINDRSQASVVVTSAPYDGVEWIHASIAKAGQMPDYADLKLLHVAVFGDGWAYQVFTPAARHINIHPYALHLWGRSDGQSVLPDFTMGMDTI